MKVGDHVAVIIAETLAQARDASEKIVVDYGVLKASADMTTARTAGAARGVGPRVRLGRAGAALVTTGQFRRSRRCRVTARAQPVRAGL